MKSQLSLALGLAGGLVAQVPDFTPTTPLIAAQGEPRVLYSAQPTGE